MKKKVKYPKSAPIKKQEQPINAAAWSDEALIAAAWSDEAIAAAETEWQEKCRESGITLNG